ncbi:unnamed protein product, partial [Lymnaea stagnalis]
VETSSRKIFIFSAIIQPPIYLLGFVANLINIFVYFKIRPKDCINICFFVLSCADLASVLMLILGEIFHVFTNNFEKLWDIEDKDLSFLFVFYHGSFYISQGITTFTAVQKGWSVALPFRSRNPFIASITYGILSGISIAIFSLHVPIRSRPDLQESMSADTSRPLLLVWTAEIRQQLFPGVRLVSLLFTSTCQVIVIFCLIVLASRLRASTNLMDSSAIPNVDMDPPTTTK